MKIKIIFSLGKLNYNNYLKLVSKFNFQKNNFKNKYEYKISKLNDEKLDKLQKKIISKLCKSFADGLDFYNYSENHSNSNLK